MDLSAELERIRKEDYNEIDRKLARKVTQAGDLQDFHSFIGAQLCKAGRPPSPNFPSHQLSHQSSNKPNPPSKCSVEALKIQMAKLKYDFAEMTSQMKLIVAETSLQTQKEALQLSSQLMKEKKELQQELICIKQAYKNLMKENSQLVAENSEIRQANNLRNAPSDSNQTIVSNFSRATPLRQNTPSKKGLSPLKNRSSHSIERKNKENFVSLVAKENMSKYGKLKVVCESTKDTQTKLFCMF